MGGLKYFLQLKKKTEKGAEHHLRQYSTKPEVLNFQAN
jgi:hypothetical protein